jgi:hypothetical protein
MAKIALISCVSKKASQKCKASKMYQSPLFTMSYEYAQKQIKPDKIFILSAKYGLLNPDRIIEPYNETLNEKTKKEICEWANSVLKTISSSCDIEKDTFYILAGKKYYCQLVSGLKHFEIIMENLPIGKRLQWLKKALA